MSFDIFNLSLAPVNHLAFANGTLHLLPPYYIFRKSIFPLNPCDSVLQFFCDTKFCTLSKSILFQLPSLSSLLFRSAHLHSAIGTSPVGVVSVLACVHHLTAAVTTDHGFLLFYFNIFKLNFFRFFFLRNVLIIFHSF